MSDKFKYQSIYAPYFKQFIAMKQSLGYVPLRTEWIFLEFDNFFLDRNVTELGITKEQVDKWRTTRINDAPSTIYTKFSALSQFSKFLCKVGYKSHIPRMPVNPAKNSFIPYIFTNREMQTIFRVCDNLRLYDRHMSTIQFIIPTIIRLLYGTGLRISEAVSLKNRDIDLNKCSIHIRKAKNGEERLVPLSNTLTEVLKQYLHYRDSCHYLEFVISMDFSLSLQMEHIVVPVQYIPGLGRCWKNLVYLFMGTTEDLAFMI